MLPENLLNKQIYCLVFLGLGKFSTTIPGCLPKLKYVNVVTVSLQPSISFLGFGQVIFIKRIPKIFENAVQQLILPPHSLISVLYFSWLKDRKTKLPTLLSLWAQTNSPAMAEGQHAAVQKGFGVFRQRSFSARCLHLMSPSFVSLGSRHLQLFALSWYFWAASVQFWRWSMIRAEGVSCSPSPGYLSDLIAYACIMCGVTSSGRRNTAFRSSIYRNFLLIWAVSNLKNSKCGKIQNGWVLPVVTQPVLGYGRNCQSGLDRSIGTLWMLAKLELHLTEGLGTLN